MKFIYLYIIMLIIFIYYLHQTRETFGTSPGTLIQLMATAPSNGLIPILYTNYVGKKKVFSY
jgi:hypothetical protein